VRYFFKSHDEIQNVAVRDQGHLRFYSIKLKNAKAASTSLEKCTLMVQWEGKKCKVTMLKDKCASNCISFC